jgi:hypothetical protein
MANVLTSLRAHPAVDTAPMRTRIPVLRRQEQFQNELLKAATTPKIANASPVVKTPDTCATSDLRGLCTGPVFPAVADTPAQTPNPTAESVFGPNPWLSNPTGIAPNGQRYSYNPFYFATRETAAKVAEMAGGTVVESNMLTGGGGGFAQSQPNYMVRLSDGRMINPGLVASFYAHGYSQSYVDLMVDSEFRSA